MWQVYFKELLELARDKKTLFFIIALPIIIFPVLFGFMALVIVNVAIDEQKKVLNYAIINGDKAPEFNQAMIYHRDFKKVDLEFIDEQAIHNAISANKVNLVLKIPDDFSLLSTKEKQAHWVIYFNNASQMNSVKQKVNKVFDTYVKDLRLEHLTELGLSIEQYELLKTPIKLESIDTADQRENFGEKVGGFIPYMLIILCLTGAMYPAIDLGAGEKERGTLETLLLTPIARLSLVLGKFLTIMTTSITTALITVSSLVFWSYLIGKITEVKQVAEIMAAVGLADVILMILMLVPISAIFAALVLAISIYARSYKEAQNYMGPLTMVTFMPVMVAMLPGISLDSFWAFVPVSNVALAIKEILKGTIEASTVFYIFSSTAVFALLALWFCTHWFKKEAVLFR